MYELVILAKQISACGYGAHLYFCHTIVPPLVK